MISASDSEASIFHWDAILCLSSFELVIVRGEKLTRQQRRPIPTTRTTKKGHFAVDINQKKRVFSFHNQSISPPQILASLGGGGVHTTNMIILV